MKELLCKLKIKREKGWVYFITSDEEGYIIIGRGADEKRLNTMRKNLEKKENGRE